MWVPNLPEGVEKKTTDQCGYLPEGVEHHTGDHPCDHEADKQGCAKGLLLHILGHLGSLQSNHAVTAERNIYTTTIPNSNLLLSYWRIWCITWHAKIPLPPTPPTTTTLSRLTPYNSTALHKFKGRKWQTSETLQDVESFSPSHLHNPLTVVATVNFTGFSVWACLHPHRYQHWYSGPAYIHTGTSTGKVGLLTSTKVPALVRWACLHPQRCQHW